MMKILLVFIVLVHGLILTKLQFFPYPELFIYPYLNNSGLKPYQEILDQHFPGLMFLPINFDNLGMTDPQIARIWLIFIVIIIQLFLFLIARSILKSEKKALFVNILYLFWQPFFEGWVFWIDNLLPLLLLPSFYCLYKNKFFICGLLLGIGIVFKQTLIPLTFLVLIYSFWDSRDRHQIIKLVGGILIPMALMLLYFISIGVIKDFWYWTVVFNLTTYAKFGTSTPASVGFVTRVLLVYSTSILLWFHKDRRLIQILFLFLAGSLIGIFDRADFVHFQPSLPFVLLATALGVYSISKTTLAKFGIFIYVVITFWWQKVFYSGHISNKVLLFDEQTKQTALKIRQYTNVGEKIFIFGAVPQLYQMSETLPAGNIFVFQFPWFLAVAEGRILEGIEKDQPKIIISDRTINIEGQAITDYAKNIDQYIQKNYKIIDQVGTTSIMNRNSL